MNGNGFENAGRKLLSSPSAVFLAVLTAGLATASFARHTGLYAPSNDASRANVVLACPRPKVVAHPTKAGAQPSQPSHPKASAAAPQSPASAAAPAVASNNVSPEKHATGKTGGSGGSVSLPLPDFSTPELSRFISPL